MASMNSTIIKANAITNAPAIHPETTASILHLPSLGSLGAVFLVRISNISEITNHMTAARGGPKKTK